MSPDAPDVPPPPPPPPVVDDAEEAARVARQRRSLEKRRTGRKSLVIEPQGPQAAQGGLQIPKG